MPSTSYESLSKRFLNPDAFPPWVPQRESPGVATAMCVCTCVCVHPHSMDDHLPPEDLEEVLWFLVLDHADLDRSTSVLVIQCHCVYGCSAALILGRGGGGGGGGVNIRSQCDLTKLGHFSTPLLVAFPLLSHAVPLLCPTPIPPLTTCAPPPSLPSQPVPHPHPSPHNLCPTPTPPLTACAPPPPLPSQPVPHPHPSPHSLCPTWVDSCPSQK